MHICPKCLEEFDDADDFFEHYTLCDEEGEA